MRVVLADDDARFRALARRLLDGGRGGVRIVGEARDAAGARALVAALAPDLALIDVHLGDDDGRALGAELATGAGAVSVVLMSSDPDAAAPGLPFVAKADLAATDLRALRAGAPVG